MVQSSIIRAAVSAMAVATVLCVPAIVQAQVHTINVPAQAASSGVREFAQQAGIQIIVSGHDADGRTTNAVQGGLDTREGLEQLLAETGLSIRSFDGKVAILGMDDKTASGGSAIVVTGTRIVRDGYQAPTPVTVLGREEIDRRAPHNLAEMVNSLPALSGSQNPQMGANNISSGVTGINTLNLRGIGQTRTLVLFDGQRMPAASLSGLVDVNTIPNALIKRIDIVTGGASAAWGSDAVAGVVNFVLDKEFTGVKGDVQGGVTTYGDDKNFRVSLTAGSSFADGRGHILLSAENAYNEGILGIGKRDWYKGLKGFNNPAYTPTNGQPRIIVSEEVGLTTAGPGAIVSAGPLRGLYFGPGGVPAQLNYGAIVSDPYMVGGDWQSTHFDTDVQTFDPEVSRQNLFGRLSYQVTDNVQVYGQFSYSRSKGTSTATPFYNFGSLVISRDNAFLPDEVVKRMSDLGLSSMNVGTWNEDLGGVRTVNVHQMYRYVLGASGKFDGLGSSWNWDVSANRNISQFYDYAISPITANYKKAIDAVRGPNGSIICRSTLTTPGDGCVPLNIFGVGVASDAAKNYVLGKSYVDAKLTQDVYSANVRGEPFSTWAGPVSMAAGYEHRQEKEGGTADPLSMVNGYWAGNFKPLKGSYNVDEAFLEVAVPLAANMRWAKSLDLNAAVRATDYSTSGYVTTWKIGATYAPVEDIKFRVTRSRDIRAANIAELFQAGTAGTYLFADPAKNNESYQFIALTSGNPTVKPEKADTLNVGAVFQPRFIPGLSASVDYWDIKIKDAIAALGYSTVVNLCFQGNQDLCQYVNRNADGYITEVYLRPINLAKAVARGIDFEASYRFPISNIFTNSDSESLSLRALATRNIKSVTEDGVSLPNSALGENGALPKWRYLVEAIYSGGPVTASLSGRGISAGVYDASWIECSTNCPTSTVQNMTVNKNHVAGAFYVDMSLALKIYKNVELYMSVDNLFNKNPADFATINYIGGAITGANATFYDILGRRFRSGIRFKL